MNEVQGFAHPVPRGYWAMTRFHKDARPKPIMGKQAKPVVYVSEAEALKAVVRSMTDYFNSPMYRAGETLTSTKECAEKVFKKVSRKGPKK